MNILKFDYDWLPKYNCYAIIQSEMLLERQCRHRVILKYAPSCQWIYTIIVIFKNYYTLSSEDTNE